MTPARLEFFREHISRASNITPAMGAELLEHVEQLEAHEKMLRAAVESTHRLGRDGKRLLCARCGYYVDEHSPQTCEVAAALRDTAPEGA